MMMSKKTTIMLLATIGASLSCIAPKLPSSFAFLQSYCQILVAVATLVLIYVWWEKLRPNRIPEITCCPVSGFLAIVTFSYATF